MIKFRPHHFMCTIGFQGNGYSSAFVSNYQYICDRLKNMDGNDVEITVVGQTDSICAPCPNRFGQLCSDQEKIQSLDQRHSEALGITPGMTIKWGEAKKLIAERIDEEQFNRICEGCSWKNLGLCLEALQKLQSHPL